MQGSVSDGNFALGAAIHYDFELATNPQPFETLVKSLFGVSSPTGEFVHWFRPLKGKRTPPPPPLDVDKLVRLVRRGVASAAAETAPNTADSDLLLVVAGTRPINDGPERFTMTKCRYNAVIAAGAARLRRLGVQRVIDAIVAFADAVEVRAGVVHCADSSTYASALASCGASGLSRAESDHVSDLMYFEPQWGDVIRGPAWGTFLGAAHVARLGGAAHIADSAPCAGVSSLRSGGSYLQATPSEAPLLEHDPSLATTLEKLARFLDPVTGHRVP